MKKLQQNKDSEKLFISPDVTIESLDSGKKEPLSEKVEFESIDPGISAPQSDSRKTLAVVVVAVLLLISLIGFTIWRVYTNSNTKDAKNGDLTLENVSAEVKDQLSEKLVYAKTYGEGATKYYSPSLDAVLEVDDATESVSENADYLSLYIKKAGFEYPFYVTIQKTDLSIDEFVDSKCALADNCNKSSLSEQNSMIEVRFNFDRKSYFTTENTTEKVFAAAYQLSDVEGYVMYMYVVDENDNKLNEFSEAALKVFKTLDTSVEGVDSELLISLEDGLVTLPLNRKDWTIDVSSSGTYFSAHHRKSESAEKDESYLASGYISASVETLYDGTVAEMHADNSKIAEYEKEYGAKYTIENENIIIDGVEFTHSMYEMVQYETQPEIITYKASYTGLLDKSQKVISINYTLYSDKELSTSAAKAILALIPKFDFSDKEIAAITPTENGDVLGTNTMTIDKVAFLAQPSVAQIFNKTCVNVVVNEAYTSAMYVGKTYEICGAGTGTGFYVNGDGYMVTNAHVAAPNPTDILVGAIYGNNYDPDGFAEDFYFIALELIDAEYGVENFTQAQLVELVMAYAPKLVVLIEDEKGITIDSTKYTNYIQATEVFVVSGVNFELQNQDEHYTSEVIDHNEIESMAQMEFDLAKNGTMPAIAAADLALLKVDTRGNAVSSLPLSDADSVLVGSDIRVIGYPGAAANEMLFSSESTRIPTLTTGTISAIKPNATNAFNLIQFDASISGGNSGGPILNENGSVVAVATYGVSPNELAADYNAGVSVSEVTEILERNDIVGSSSELSLLLEKTVFYLDSQYYKWAAANLEKAIVLNPDLESTLAPLMTYANSQIEAGEDKSPLFAIGSLYIGIIEIILAVVVIVVLVAVIVVVMMMKKKGGKAKVNANPVIPVQPQAQPAVIAPAPVQSAAPVQAPFPSAPVNSASVSQQVSSAPTPYTPVQPTMTQMPVQPTPVSEPQVTVVEPVVMPEAPMQAPIQPVQQAPVQQANPFSPNLSSQTVAPVAQVEEPTPMQVPAQPVAPQQMAPSQQPAPNPMYGLNQPVPPVSPAGMFHNSQIGVAANPSVAPQQVAQPVPQTPVNPTQPQTPLS